MQKVRVGVLRGGPSNEYDVSLKTGETVLKNLPDHYIPVDIFISRDGVWHRGGFEVTPHEALYHVDVAWNALHGHYGEDGKIQHILELHRVPFTGSGSFASAIGMNKVLTKELLERHAIRTPSCLVVSDHPDEFSPEDLLDMFRKFAPPIIVKPARGGSSIGVSLVKIFSQFKDALHRAFEHDRKVMIEEYIPGIEASVAVIENYRDQHHYVLPPIEIRPEGSPGNSFFDFLAKYESKSLEIIPGNFTPAQKRELESLAQKVHTTFGLRHYSRTDFIVSPRRGIYVIETNTLPGLTEASLFPKALSAVGAPMPHFLDHVLTLALEQK